MKEILLQNPYETLRIPPKGFEKYLLQALLTNNVPASTYIYTHYM